MYNRYIPNSNGVYTRQSIPEPPAPAVRQTQESKAVQDDAQRNVPTKQTTNQRWGPMIDTGDLLLLCIILLLLVDSEEDSMTLLITAAAFLLL